MQAKSWMPAAAASSRDSIQQSSKTGKNQGGGRENPMQQRGPQLLQGWQQSHQQHEVTPTKAVVTESSSSNPRSAFNAKNQNTNGA